MKCRSQIGRDLIVFIQDKLDKKRRAAPHSHSLVPPWKKKARQPKKRKGKREKVRTSASHSPLPRQNQRDFSKISNAEPTAAARGSTGAFEGGSPFFFGPAEIDQ